MIQSDPISMLSWALLLSGLFFILAGIIGVLRLPDFYSRLHAQGKCDTLGVSLMLAGLAVNELHHGLTLEHILTALKIMGVLFFVWLANPTATHALGRAAHSSGLKPWTKADSKEGQGV